MNADDSAPPDMPAYRRSSAVPWVFENCYGHIPRRADWMNRRADVATPASPAIHLPTKIEATRFDRIARALCTRRRAPRLASPAICH
jgi:hypothetical protein